MAPHGDKQMSASSSDAATYQTGDTGLVRKTPEATLTIGVVWKRPHDRLLLVRLREWAIQQAASRKLPFDLTIQSLPSVAEALDWRAESMAKRLIVAAGFGGHELGSLQIDTSRHEPVLAVPSDSLARAALPSATFLNVPSVLECDQDTLLKQLRKSILRSVLRSRIVIRSPLTDAEISEYFALRYRVWESVGFLRSRNLESKLKWEVDHADRTSVPLVAISAEGRIVGCTRLVRSFGREEPYYVSHIQALLDRTCDSTLSALFRYPHSMAHPFDVLEAFPGFRMQFKVLMTDKVEVGEIGRVAVDAEYRGQSIAEAVVDTAVSLAQRRGVGCIFLACHEAMRSLYAKCLFRPVEGLRSDTFLNIQLPSIVMNRYL